MHECKSMCKRALARLPVVIPIWFLAIIFPFFGPINSTVGSLLVSFTVYIIPALAHMITFASPSARERRINPHELDNEALAFKPVLGSMLARIYHNPQNKEENQSRLQKILQFWASKEVYDHITIHALENEMIGGPPTNFFPIFGGGGKTYTMKPLPLKASRDILKLMQHTYWNQGFQLKLCMREDGKQQVCIVGLQQCKVSDVETIQELIEKGNATRSAGTTGANEESSRSHAIL
ncbi:hypothetical protein HYC85_023336 [Camellia sinensis]|uniref:Kinesin motor domain-containing protein n=1 Tax=Camellia sinensis TaxID=4442 RepID=A0A7J7GEY2_CAMSI|nr:hypothetical protein HYC85_023336 [Camellia sinensis]